MVISSCILYLLLLAVHESIQKSSPGSLTYRAAVVELRPVFYENDSAKTLDDNAKKIVGFIEQAAEKDADIVVFPELGLTSLISGERPHLVSRGILVPDPSENYAPCTNSSIPVNEALKKIACAAEHNSIYVVVNLFEKEVCSNNKCPSDGIFLYITSVAFDRKGKIIARYRKSHLLDQYGLLDVTKTPELSTFDTDFGVTFGNVICLDILYEEPWLTLTRKLNVTDIIYSSGWISEMPFLSTIQLEASWAYAENVNILASGHNKVDSSNSGSGIYTGRGGVITAILPLHDHEELLVADVRKKTQKSAASLMSQTHNENRLRLTNPTQERHPHNEFNKGRDSRSFKWRYEKLDAYKTKVIANEGLTLQKLKHFGINCSFQVNVTNLHPPTTYRLLAFDGARSVGKSTKLGIRVCAIVQCANDRLDSCGHIQNSSATFNFVTISATYADNMRTVMMPSTLGTDMLPLKKWTYKEVEFKERVSKSISLTMPTQNLVTFGVWGRNFAKDKLHDDVPHEYKQDKTNSAPIRHIPLFFILLENLIGFL